MRLVITIAAALVALPVAVGLYFTSRTARDPRQADFAAGRIPDPLPDGPYRGSVPGYESLAQAWKGKRFVMAAASGVNLVRAGDSLKEDFPFRTYVAKALDGSDREVFRVDYDVPTNPGWLRVCADELVEVAPGRLLGKSYIRLLPDRPFAMLFFELAEGEPGAAAGASGGIAAAG